jgi:hypothetical protein
MTLIETYILLRDEWEDMQEGPVKDATKKALEELWFNIVTFRGLFPNETAEDHYERTNMACWDSYQCPYCKEPMYGPLNTRETRFAQRITCEHCGMKFMATSGNRGNGICFPSNRGYYL